MKTLKHTLLIIASVLCVQKMNAQVASDFVYPRDSVSNVVLPNVFTPNFDSINDVFRPRLDEITEMSFSIFNRYGNLIFETTRVSGFWDGRTTSGDPCTDGVYFCVFTATGIDGKKYKEKTFVQLFTNGFYKN